MTTQGVATAARVGEYSVPMARIGMVAVAGLLLVAGACDGSASGSGVIVTPKCIAAYACAELVVDVVPPSSTQFRFDAGSGSVVSLPTIDCTITLGVESGTCSNTFSWPIGTNPPNVIETATASTGSVVCTVPSGAGCGFSDYHQEATFAAVPIAGQNDIWTVSFALDRVTVGVSLSGPGTGIVRGDPSADYTSPQQIDCTNTTQISQCLATFDYGIPMLLTATASAGSLFSGWTGPCAGQGAICTLKPTATRTDITADFSLASQTTTTATTPTNPSTTTTSTTTTTAPAAHPGLQAQLIAIGSRKSRLGLRLEQVEIQAGEPLTAILVLSRAGKRLARATILGIRPGDRVLVVAIPSTVAKGKASLAVTVSDSAGNHRTWRRIVTVAR
jgi:Divergent InlB B-repeat domain